MIADSLAEWTTFLAVQAGAAATLTGLVFVAVSINLARIVDFPGLPERAGESILQFLEVFFTSAAALIPGQSIAMLGREILAIGIICWGMQVRGLIQYLRARYGHPWSWFVHRAILSQLATIPFCIAGAALLLDAPNALYWLVPGFAFSFAAGMISAWVLLIEILR